MVPVLRSSAEEALHRARDTRLLVASCAGLTRASIHLHKMRFAKRMDCRVKPGNDGVDD
jgi:hypothetical protein